MTAEDDALEALRNSGLIDALTWAAPVAFARTGQDYDEDAGHDQMVIGTLNFVYMRDLLDRVTSNERYTVSDDGDERGRDLLVRGITPEAFKTMPQVPSGQIGRNNYKGSPGWASGGYRVLLQSYKVGKINNINWAQHSNAKKQVASQKFGDGLLALLGDFELEGVDGIPDDDGFEGTTLVAAHAYNPSTGAFELYVGQSKNPASRGDDCWHWKHPLLLGGHAGGIEEMVTPPTLPGDGASTVVDDIDVQIKKPRASGEAGSERG